MLMSEIDEKENAIRELKVQRLVYIKVSQTKTSHLV